MAQSNPSEKYEFASVQKKILKLNFLWPREEHLILSGENHVDKNVKTLWQRLKSYVFLWSLLPTTFIVLFDAVMLIIEDDSDVIEALQPILALFCIIGHHYLSLCCLQNGPLLVQILDAVERMKSFRPLEEIIEIDRKATWFYKLMLIYSGIGGFTYVTMPLLPTALRDCRATKTPSMIRNGIPCGLACRARLPFASYINSNVLEIIYYCIYVHQAYLILNVTFLVITLTMLLNSIVMQCVYHFRQLRIMFESIDEHNGDHGLLIKCIYYHISIIRLCADMNEAFGTQMAMFLILPSFAISLLCFELLIVGFTDMLRFGLHLLGWIALLLMVNFGGQILMDESKGIAETAYTIKWYEYKVHFQKDLYMVIMRSQKPIQLNAMNIGSLSLETFLAVISSAYSYLTMLINMK